MANRLAGETSPYLLQHKDNPVDWHPWGDEALSKAKAEDKPLLISIGYAACHWCHVMERESFEDNQTASVMNEHFVNIKVDREERPDLDSVYMAATQAMTGHGGWPMTVFCAPDGIPFLAGTYFPPEDRHGLPGFRTVLERVTELWKTRRPDLLAQGQKVIETIDRGTPQPSTEPLHANLLANAAGQIVATHDKTHGGFGSAPKFPQAPVLEFLLRMAKRSPAVTDALDRTLRKMALGGIYDQIGGGFARYAVDTTWTVPHFEKMLYDNAQLARVYTYAWQATNNPLYRRIAIETLEYLLRDMRDAAGGFHSSEDADSEGEEGKFYLWDYDEFMAIAPDAETYYGVTPHGNFEGHNILVATTEGDPNEQTRAKLLEARSKRVRPGKDDKVLASWNGLAIAAFAETGASFQRDDFTAAAAEAAAFILDEMQRDGRLLHSYRAGQTQIPGFLEDYAFLADGLLALWESTFDARWLREANRLAEAAVELFGARDGGFYTTGTDAERLVVRQLEIIESATPSPAGVLALVLQRLSVLFDRSELARPAVDALRVARIYMERATQAVPTWLSALDFYVSNAVEVAFTGDLETKEGRALVDTVHSRFLPNRVLAARSTQDPWVNDLALLRDKPDAHQPTAYVCERYVCQSPTSDPAELAKQLA